jgi:hypothetical protein
MFFAAQLSSYNKRWWSGQSVSDQSAATLIVRPASAAESSSEVDNPDAHSLVFYNSPGERDGQVEPARADASRIQVDDAVAIFQLRTVRMSIDDNLYARSRWRQVEVVDGMYKVEQATTQFDRFCGGQLRAGS